jgi:hypothetical protein
MASTYDLIAVDGNKVMRASDGRLVLMAAGKMMTFSTLAEELYEIIQWLNDYAESNLLT